MSAAAVLRSACRALRRPSSFPRANEQRFLHRSPMPRETIGPRRLYSSDCDMKGAAELNKNSHQDHHFFERHLGRPGRLRSSGHENLIVPKNKVKAEERVFLTLDEVDSIFDRQGILIKELEVAILEKIKRDRRRRLLVRGSIFVGLAVYVKKHFFGGSSQEANKGMTESN